MGDDNKIAAMMFLFLGAFLFWLQTQGKLIPLFQQLFGMGAEGQKAAAPSTSAAVPNTGQGVLGILGQVYGTLQQNGTIPNTGAGAIPGAKAPATPAPGNPGPLPGFTSTASSDPNTYTV